MPHEIHPDWDTPDALSTLDAIRRLQADRAHRDARLRFFVEGVRNVVQAIESGFHIETLVYSEKLLIFDYPRPTILVLGEERRGLTPLQRDLCSDLVRIPMVGVADSLNLAVAGSLLLYEVYRARSVRRARSP